MADFSPNPYESPSPLPGKAPAKPAVSLLRGFAAGGIAALIGFAIPAICGCISLRVNSLTEVGRAFDHLAETCVTFAALLGLAAITSFTPSRRADFILTFLYLAGFAFLGIVLMRVVTRAFDLGPQTKTSDPYRWLRISIVLAVMVAGATAVTWRQIRNIQEHPT
jgi:hypothetical protein